MCASENYLERVNDKVTYIPTGKAKRSSRYNDSIAKAMYILLPTVQRNVAFTIRSLSKLLTSVALVIIIENRMLSKTLLMILLLVKQIWINLVLLLNDSAYDH